MTDADAPATCGAHDFDFLFGRWQVQHRRLQTRLAGCTAWDEFAGTADCWPLLGGHGNVDDNRLALPAGAYRAVTLRSWDAAAQVWSIWWLDGRQPRALDTPVVGGFAGGVGRFVADDVLGGRAVQVRFLWTLTTTAQPRWAQACSDDGGLTWETNWTMDFTRVA